MSDGSQLISYQILSSIITFILAFIDIKKDIWLPPKSINKIYPVFLMICLVFGHVAISFALYTWINSSTIIDSIIDLVGLSPALFAIFIGGGYFFLIRIVSIRLSIGSNTTEELSLYSLIYEPIERFVFTNIDQYIEPFLNDEIDRVIANKDLAGIMEVFRQRVINLNDRISTQEQKDYYLQWLLDLAQYEEWSEELKKKTIAKYLVIYQFPPLKS